jgi:DNA polymerase-3 subunit beta
MEFRVGKQALLTELNLLQGIVERKNTIPILTNLLLEVDGQSGISMIATDLDVSLQTECAADVLKPGSALIQARKLFDIVRSLPDSDIAFEKEGGDWVKVTSGYSHFKLVAQAKEHFPSVAQAKPGLIELKPASLHGLISRTIFAITQEESRYALSGALLLISGSTATMVTTDAHRLAMANCPLETPAEDVRLIVPRKALSELLKLAASTDQPVVFSKDENHIFFKFGQRQLSSRMLAGQFPNYDMVIPKNNDKTLSISLDKLSQAIKRVALMADERSHGIRCEIEDGTLTMTSQTADLGESREIIQVDFKGPKVVVKFNASYLIDFLNVVDTDDVLIELKDDQTPVLFRPAEGSAASYKYVVMPMRL